MKIPFSIYLILALITGVVIGTAVSLHRMFEGLQNAGCIK